MCDFCGYFMQNFAYFKYYISASLQCVTKQVVCTKGFLESICSMSLLDGACECSS